MLADDNNKGIRIDFFIWIIIKHFFHWYRKYAKVKQLNLILVKLVQ